MKTLMKFAVVALALGFSASAHARGGPPTSQLPPQAPSNPVNPNVAPEVDPSLAICGFTLLGGTLTVLRSRRRR
jgi:hypothetical protein